MEYRITGTTLLPLIDIERAVYPHLGEDRTLADVEKAREALEKTYHEAGYLTVLVNIPQQKVDGGVVTLAATEAPVDRLRVVESRYFSLGEIKAAVPELAEGNVPQFAQMQEELAALNRSPDRRVSPVLRPGKNPGTVEVDLKVQDNLPVHGSLEINNQQSQDTSPTRLTGSLRFDNLWQQQHSLSLTVQYAPEREDDSRVISASYTVPLDSGNFFSLYGVKSDSDVAAVGTQNVIGRGSILGTRYIRSLRGTDKFFHTASFGLDYKDFDQEVKLSSTTGFNTPIAYMPASLGWDGTWLSEGGTSRLGLTFNFHTPGMVGTDQQFADKRYKGRAGYSYIRGNASHSLTQPSGWGLVARASWQLSGQALISNEQFSIGGAETVRGYLESTAAGDNGLAGSLELLAPNMLKLADDSVNEMRLVAFVDAGSVQVLDALTATTNYNLSSIGLGLRVRGWSGLSASADWAYVLEDKEPTRRGDSRVVAKLSFQW